MTTGINVLQYWPFDIIGTAKRWTFKYVDPTGVVPSITAIFSYDAAARQLVLAEYDASGVWQDDWRMIYDPGPGVCEVSDWYPQSNKWLARVFGPTQKQNLLFPIGWGDVVDIGDAVTTFPKYDPWTSWPPFCVSGSGEQEVTFEALLPSMTLSNGVAHVNVLQFSYKQTWNGKTVGARYYNAFGVGTIAISWIGYDSTGKMVATQPRIDATVTNS